MKRFFLIGAFLVASIASRAWAEGFADAKAGEATFSVAKNGKNSVRLTSKAPGETFKGVSKTIHGHLTLDLTRLDSAKGKFSVPFKNLDTAIPARNQHMLSARWIDAEKYPDAVYAVEGIKDAHVSKSSAKAMLMGTMAIHGKKQEMSVPVTLVYSKGDVGADDQLAIRASFTVALSDYGISDRAVGRKVAEKMKLTVSVMLKAGDDAAKDGHAAGKAKARP